MLALQNVKITKPTDKGREAETPELIGRGGQGKHVIKDKGKFFAISKMAGVDDFREVVKAFLEDTPSLLEEQLLKLPGKGHDPVVSVSVILILLLLLFKCIKYSKNI